MTIYILKYTDDYDGHVWGHYSTRELAQSAFQEMVSHRKSAGFMLEIVEVRLDPPNSQITAGARW